MLYTLPTMTPANNKTAPARKEPSDDKKLGTFLGVFTPTILTILGVIMYLRSGWLVGHVGVSQMLMIVVLANGITLITAFSFSSVATNSRVGVGGAYFIISRSMGLEVGGAVGLPLFLSQTVSVTLYSYGLAESLRIIWPEVPVQSVTFVIVIAVGVLAVLGAKLALKVQVPLMMLVGVSLLALTVGALIRHSGVSLETAAGSLQGLGQQAGTAAEAAGSANAGLELAQGSATAALAFWAAFAIFFPAVTGVMAGLGLSGDLKDPGRAIPVGSISAVLVGFAVYLVIPLILSAGATPAELRENPLIWTKIALLGPWLVLPGLWAAIFSSAVGSILVAPRTLQALSRDQLAPRFFGRVTGDWRELLPGIVFSVAIALGAVLLGNLNAVAVVVTMFFLTVYGTVNMAAAVETLSGDPSWRPKVRIPWLINLLGGLACAFVMFLINPLVGILAVLIEVLIWRVLSRRERGAGWGDARRGLYESLIRWVLIQLARRPTSARNWRPHVLVFVSETAKNFELVRFADWFSGERGVVTACQLHIGDLLDEGINPLAAQQQMQSSFDEQGIVAFAEVDVVKDVVTGIVDVAQANGMAGIESNTVLIGWAKEKERLAEFLRAMRRLERVQKSFIIARLQPQHFPPREGQRRTVHVWWGGLQRNGDLMLLLAFLLTRNPFWRGARVQVMSVASNEMAQTQTETYLRKLIPEIRIQAEPRVVIKPKDVNVQDLIQAESKNADVVFMGLATPAPGEEEAYAERLQRLAGGLPSVFFVKNSSMFRGELLEPKETEPEKGAAGRT